MSLPALLWALEEAPVESPAELAVLAVLANHADTDGKNIYPPLARLARHTRLSERAVRRHLTTLRRRGLITDGNPQAVAHIRADKRPAVYDLNLDLKRGERNG